MKIFFQSSLPRTGSTLIQNIIGQNPDFYVSPTSGLYHLIDSSINSFSTAPEFKNQPDWNYQLQSFYKFCQGGINSYYSFLTSKPYILDKGGFWIKDYDLVKNIFNNPKIIVLVRDLRDIVASYEKMYIKDPTIKYSWPDYNKIQNPTFESRFDLYLNTGALPGYLLKLYDIINSNYFNEILFIKFEDLCANPNNTLTQIYNFLEVPYFNHDFNNIKQITNEIDSYNLFGEHNISNQLSLPSQNHSDIIPENISNLIYEKYYWFFNFFNYLK